ncbi:MAG: chemotaxis protein [Phycisphaerae bacterium]
MAISNQHKIMLEAGTNEFEILVFRVSNRRCGVNVAKVREVIDPQPLTKLPQTHAAMMGMFQLRSEALPLIDLCQCLGGQRGDPEQGQIIVMEYNATRVAFRVDAVEYIHRIKVGDVEALPDIEGLDDAPVTFVAHNEGQILLMIDFEKIVFDIAGQDPFERNSRNITNVAERGKRVIWLAEDSGTIRKMITSNLGMAGYLNTRAFIDGMACWTALEELVEQGRTSDVDLVITDIEMPKMDGLHLCKRIKDHQELSHLPVVVFSSLVSHDNTKKCNSVGADAQITKPEIANLVNVVDGLLENRPEPAAV